jgi:HK97 family phage major capsid protein
MNALQKALARLKDLVGELNALEAKEQLTADDLKAVGAKQVEIEAVEADIATLKKSEDIRARAAQPATVAANADVARTTLAAEAKEDMPIKQKVSLIAAATLKSRGNGQPVIKVLADGGYPQFAEAIEREFKQRQVDTTVASALIPTPLANEIIEFLRPETTFFQGGPRRVQLTNGQFNSPRGASGATAGYIGEGAKKPVTGPTFDDVNLRSKKLAGIVLITQEARNWSLPNIDSYIRDDLSSAMAQAIDLNAYFGPGTGDSPLGILMGATIRYDANDYAANKTAPSITEIDNMASKLILTLTLANIGQAPSWGWLMNYRTLEFLKNLRVGDDTGVYAYPELRVPVPMWKGFRVLVTNQVPINGGATTDESSLSLIDFRHVLYGEEEGVTVRTSDQATIDVNGVLVHLWQQNMDAILMEARHDFGKRHGAATVMLEKVRWGADMTGSP